MKHRLLNRDKRELLAWLGLLVIAIVARLIDLDGRPFHHDESQDAYFSWLAGNGDTADPRKDPFEYNPLLHGPARFYMLAATYKVLGDSDFTARLVPAMMGVLAVGLPYLLRHQLGRIAAFAAAALLALGPSFLYFSRFTREDIYLAAITLLMIVLAFRFLANPRTLTLCALTGTASLSFAIKESGGVMVGLILIFAVLAIPVQGLIERRRGNDFFDGEVARAVRAVGWWGWLYAISAAVVVYGLMFTQFLTNTSCLTTASDNPDTAGFDHPERNAHCLTALVYGLEYWIDQQAVGRNAEPAWLYVSLLVGNEWPVLLLALGGVAATIARPSTLRVFLVFFAVGVTVFHFIGSERFPWLVIHPLLPMILLAGVGIQTLWELRSRLVKGVAITGVAIGVAYLALASVRANALWPNEPRNMFVATQTSSQAKAVAQQLLALDRQYQKTNPVAPLSILIDDTEGLTFPYSWYLRDIENDQYTKLAGQTGPPTAQVLLLSNAARDEQLPNLSAYDGRPFDFRVWWIRTPYSCRVGQWWDWFKDGSTWTDTGGLRQFFYVRRDVGTLPGEGTKTELPRYREPPKSNC